MDAKLLGVLKKRNHSHFRCISCLVRLHFFKLTVTILIHSETVVFRQLCGLSTLSYLFLNVFFRCILVRIVCLVLLHHDLNHNEAGSCLQVRISDHLNEAVIDLGKWYVLIVVSQVLFHKVVDKFAWFRISILPHREVLVVEQLLSLFLVEPSLKFVASFFVYHRNE